MNRYYPVYPEPMNPLKRSRINEVLETGVKAIDSLITVGRGQRVGIFSGSGVGKSTLLGMIARNMNADVNVIALVGERGREVRDFIEDILGREGLKRSVVVVATSDQPALVRAHAALTASAIAEYFRDLGLDVVLTMDSVTRYAMALREIGLAIGEPPTARGYTPSVFASLPKLLERGGTAESGGSITAFYTVLVEGDDLNDPVADSVRSILDGHVVLSRELANRGQYPSIDVLASKSRLLLELVNEDELDVVNRTTSVIGTYRNSKDMIEIGAYKHGTSPAVDDAIRLFPELEKFLQQAPHDPVERERTMNELRSVLKRKQVA
jgi:flagellum-specific ATP synthase